jgi:N-acetylated-alpha-linked acidic dipeptidase
MELFQGKNFGAAAAPTLKKLLVETSKDVQYPYTNQSLYEFWNKTDQIEPPIGNLGGGSDHIAFYMHVGVPFNEWWCWGAKCLSF